MLLYGMPDLICRIAASMVLLALVGCADGTGPCALSAVATLPLEERSHLVVPGRLNRVDSWFVLDTGAEISHVTPEGARRAGLAIGPGLTRIEGMGGTIVAPNALADIELGGTEVRRLLPVAALPLTAVAGQVYGGLIGADLISEYELEVSMPERRVRLWRASHCEGDYVPWAGVHWAVPLHRTAEGRLLLLVTLDGTAVSALLDTGANGTMIGAHTAGRLGLDPDVVARGRAVWSRGVDGNRVQAHEHRVATMSVGNETVRGPTLLVSLAEMPEGDMILGTDWLRSRRIWISWGSRQMFVQPQLEIRAPL